MLTRAGVIGNNKVATATPALGHLTAVYCAPAWCRIAHTHLIDFAIDNA